MNSLDKVLNNWCNRFRERWEHWYFTCGWSAHAFPYSHPSEIGHIPQKTEALCGKKSHWHEPISIAHDANGFIPGAFHHGQENDILKCSVCKKKLAIMRRNETAVRKMQRA